MGIREFQTFGKALGAEWPSPHCAAQLVLVSQFSQRGLQSAGVIVSVILLDFPSLSISTHKFASTKLDKEERLLAWPLCSI